VEPAQACTAGLISWQELQNSGEDVATMAVMVPKKMGLENQIDAQIDTYYRFINHERFNWRKFIYFLVLKVIAHSDDSPLKQKVLITDDSISAKTGKNIELVSYHFDHKLGRSIANADWPDQPWQLLKKRPSSMNFEFLIFPSILFLR